MLRLPTQNIDKSGAIADALTDIGALPEVNLGGGYKRLSFEVENSHASVAFDDFELLGKTHASGAWISLITGAAWGTIAGRLLDFTGAHNTLAATASAEALIDISGLVKIKFQASTGTAGTAQVYGTAVE